MAISGYLHKVCTASHIYFCDENLYNLLSNCQGYIFINIVTMLYNRYPVRVYRSPVHVCNIYAYIDICIYLYTFI